MQSAIPSQLSLTHRSGSLQESLAGKTLLVIGATAFVAACAHISLPLPFTPVPLTLQKLRRHPGRHGARPHRRFLRDGSLSRRRRPRTSGLHPQRRVPPAWLICSAPKRRLSLLLPIGRSDRRLGGTHHATSDHTLQKRSPGRHRRDSAHLPPRRRLVRLLRPPQRLCGLVTRRCALYPRRNRKDHCRRRHLPLNPALASVLTGQPQVCIFSPTQSRRMNSAHLTIFHLQQGLIAS